MKACRRMLPLKKDSWDTCALAHHHRPHLDRSDRRSRNTRGYRHCCVQVFGFDQEVAAALLFGLGKRAAGDLFLAVSHAYRGCCGCWLQLMPAQALVVLSLIA